MNKRNLSLSIVVAALLIIGLAATGVHAQDDVKGKMKSDKTGTNPVNFQRESRLYNEHTWLNTDGDDDQNVTTFEFRTPFANGKWQFRMRARYKLLTTDLIDESGFGDMDVRFITVPYFKGTNAIAYGLEAFLDTASENSLGAGSTSLGPQIFYAKFFKGGFGPYKGGGMFAPGLQYQFSVHEAAGRNEIDQINIDLNYLMMGTSKKYWFFTDPQIIFDNENNIEYAIIDIEFGWMMAMWYEDLKGHSVYVRPSFGVGGGRPTDGSIELGYKIVGW